MSEGRDCSPAVERPVDASAPHDGKDARGASVSTLPPYELDPLTRQLIEENEAMLHRINTILREQQQLRGEVATLRDALAERDKELEVMRRKVGDAAIQACDASGKVVNYKAECGRLTEDNRRLKEEYEKVCMTLEEQTKNIRDGFANAHDNGDKAQLTELVQQIQQEIVNLLPNVDRAASSLKRCVVAGAGHPDRVLESAERELVSIQRLTHFLRRLGIGDENRVNNILSAVHKKELLSSPGDMVIVIRWMIFQAFGSGLSATEGNLKVIMSLMSTESSDNNINNNNNNDINTNSNNNIINSRVSDLIGKNKGRSVTSLVKSKISHFTK